MNPIRYTTVKLNAIGYRMVRPLFFRKSAQVAHEQMQGWLAKADQSGFLCWLAEATCWLTYPQKSITIGKLELSQRFILAAGFVKGNGYGSEADALTAVHAGENIMPGWKVMPKLVGLVEFGSFTRHPRLGNSGPVMWRDAATQSTQNRVGLKNPGAVAAAEFLQKHIIDLPHQFGINIAVSPGVDDDEQAAREVRESISAFLQRGVIPNWLTLNVSCPNTEDDPDGNQTEIRTQHLCEAALEQIEADGYTTPLWVKIGPDLAEMQYKILMRIFADLGIEAVILSNTLGQPSPENPAEQAGVGGGKLREHALNASKICTQEIRSSGYEIDVIGCGGILDGSSYRQYQEHGIEIVQYWSALVYRGPLAAAIIESEIG